MALADDVTALETDLATLKTDVEATVTPTATEDPAWTAIKDALVTNGWTAPEAPETPGEPTDAEDTAEQPAA